MGILKCIPEYQRLSCLDDLAKDGLADLILSTVEGLAFLAPLDEKI